MQSYRFVDGVYETILVVKHSKFIATLFGEVDMDKASEIVAGIKAKYPDATHNCYAYIGDINGFQTRHSDDGEPGGTAGMPMLEVLKKQGLVKSGVVVTRYFGGIKLGAGGLVGAYTTAVADAIKSANIATKSLMREIVVKSDYAIFALIESSLERQGVRVCNKVYDQDVTASIFVADSDVDTVVGLVKNLSSGRADITICEQKFI